MFFISCSFYSWMDPIKLDSKKGQDSSTFMINHLLFEHDKLNGRRGKKIRLIIQDSSCF